MVNVEVIKIQKASLFTQKNKNSTCGVDHTSV